MPSVLFLVIPIKFFVIGFIQPLQLCEMLQLLHWHHPKAKNLDHTLLMQKENAFIVFVLLDVLNQQAVFLLGVANRKNQSLVFYIARNYLLIHPLVLRCVRNIDVRVKRLVLSLNEKKKLLFFPKLAKKKTK